MSISAPAKNERTLEIYFPPNDIIDSPLDAGFISHFNTEYPGGNYIVPLFLSSGTHSCKKMQIKLDIILCLDLHFLNDLWNKE